MTTPQIYRRGRLILLALVATIGAAASVMIADVVRQKEWRLVEADFVAESEARGGAIHRELQADLEVLHAIAAFYAGSENVNHDEFEVFTTPFLNRHRSILALEWAPRVTIHQRENFERTISRQEKVAVLSEIGANRNLQTAGVREEYFPVEFLSQPKGARTSTYGFDHASDPPRKRAIEKARDSGSPTVTESLDLFLVDPKTEKKTGILIAMPIYKNGLPTVTMEQRRENLTGFIIGVFRVSDIVEAGIGVLAPAGIDVSIADATKPGVLPSIYGPTSKTTGGYQLAGGSFAGIHRLTIPVLNRRWQYVFKPTASFVESRLTRIPTIVLCGGLLFTFVVVAYVALLGGRANYVECLVDERTSALALANRDLEREIGERNLAEQKLREHAKCLTSINAELAAARERNDVHLEQLKTKNRELDEFSYVASHDLQEPLRKLIAFSDLLKEDLGDNINDDAKHDLEFIVDAAQRMRSLVQALLSLSRLGKTAMKVECVSIDDCVADALHTLEMRLQETNAEIQRDTLPLVHGDRTLITQLYQNLVSNALKFRTDATPVITLTAEQRGDEWVLGVKDNGIGMKPEYADRVFQPFQRLHNRNEYEGTGIGLSICRGTIEKHAGKIWVESELNQGAHFFFTLPIYHEDSTCEPLMKTTSSSC